MIESFSTLKKKLSEREPRRMEGVGIRETSVALILTPGKLGLEALFIRRAERLDDPWSGHIALPGGRRDPGDEDRLSTAVRETREEVGVELPQSSLLGALDDLTPSTPRLPPLVISPYVFGVAPRPAARLSEEVAEVFWLPLSELAFCEGKSSVTVHGETREVACYSCGGLVIWGLTYRLLSGFLQLSA